MLHHHSIYPFLKDFITFGLTLAGITIAGMGLSTWRKQMKGGKDFKVSYNLNYSLLKLRNAIKYVRNPAIWPSETIMAMEHFKGKHPEATDDEIKKSSHSYVYELRWEKIIEAYEKVESYLIGAEVLWGSEILSKMKPLRKKINELNTMLRQNFYPHDMKTTPAKEVHKVIYDMGDEENPDEFTKEVNKCIEEITTYIKGKIK